MTSRHTLFHIFTGLFLALFIISASVTLALNFRFIYYGDIDRYELDKASGLTKEELKEDYRVLIIYNSPWGPDELSFPHFTMSEGGRQHFREAKAIFMFFFYGIFMFGIPALLGIIIAKKKRLGCAYLMISSVISILLPSALGLFAVFAWDRFFVMFHELSFGNDLWLFDPAEDPVITVLPGEYFFHEALAIFMLVIAGGLICAALWKISARRVKSKA